MLESNNSVSLSDIVQAPIEENPWEQMRDYYLSLCDSDSVLQDIEQAKQKPKNKTLALACHLTSIVQPDPAVLRWHKAQWSHILDVIANQYLLNRNLIEGFEKGELDPLGQSLNPKYGQLPCARVTVERRIHFAKLLCEPHEPIMVIGDDDLLCLALVEAGFKKVTVLEIDPYVIKQIESHPHGKSGHLTILQQDLQKPLPKSLKRSQQVIFVDPYYTVEGVAMFLKAASEMINLGEESSIFLSVHLMSLLEEGVNEVLDIVKGHSLELITFLPAYNIYPIPKINQLMIKAVNRLLIRETRLKSIHKFEYFFSDAAVLAPLHSQQE